MALVNSTVTGHLVTALSCLLVGFVLRWSVTQFPYSGQGNPPNFGDYEAQRHWMEITTQIPIQYWYVDVPGNNLNYWGLDYPPLSAYHSYGLGVFFWNIMPESVQLRTSRGFESPQHKFWMRLTVLLSDILVPALLFFFFFILTPNASQVVTTRWVSGLVGVMAPAFILVDYAHFQYNCVSLGLTVLAIGFVALDQMSIGALLFTLAVNHKQMSLYHALPFFIQMVAATIFKKRRILTVFRVALVILSTMGLLWLPFGDAWTDVLHRIFPVKRGVYEDKVGSFWYVLDRFLHLKERVSDSDMTRLCTFTSILIVIPSLFRHFNVIVNKKTKSDESLKTFLLSLLNTSLLLFLFSYHVHEKSIMLPGLPAVLLFPWYPLQSLWFTTVSSLSLYPLFLQEGSQLALLALTAIYVLTATQLTDFAKYSKWIKLSFVGSVLSYLSLIAGLHFIPRPNHLPHLYQSGIAIVSFLHYAAFCIHFHLLIFDIDTNTAQPIGNKKGN